MAKRTSKTTEQPQASTSILPPALQNPVKLGAPIAAPASTATSKPLTGVAAMLAKAKGAGATEVTKTTKKGTPDMDVPDSITQQLETFVYCAARVKAAEGEAGAVRAPIETELKKAFLAKIRSEGVFFKTVNVDDLISFSYGRLALEKPSAERPIEKIEEDLRALLGKDYDKYVKGGMALSIKSAALEGEAKTMQTMELLQEKLGDKFGELFDFSGYLGLHELALGAKDTVAYLTKDFITSADFEAKLKPAFDKKLIALSNTTFSSSKQAIAAAGEKLATEMEAVMAAKTKDDLIESLRAEVEHLRKMLPKPAPTAA